MDIWHVLVCHGFLPRQHYRTAYFPIQGLVFAAITHSQHPHLCLHNNYLSSPATLGENRQPQRKFQYYISAALPYSGDNILKKILENITFFMHLYRHFHLSQHRPPSECIFSPMHEIWVYCFYLFPGRMNGSDCSCKLLLLACCLLNFDENNFPRLRPSAEKRGKLPQVAS